MRRLKTTFVTALVVWTPASCVHLPEANPAPPVEMPAAFAESSDAPLPDRWWEDFGDDELNRLVDSALAGNFDIAGAFARLDQAEAIAVQAGAGLWPSISATGQASRSVRPMTFNIPGGGDTIETTTYDASLGAAYELDVWGKNRSRRSAATLDVEASRNDLESMAMTVAAQTADTWFALVAARAEVTLIEQQLATNEQFLELIELRFAQGLAGGLDVFQQKQIVAGSRARLEMAHAGRAVLEKQLAVVVGRPPAEIVSGERGLLPTLPALPGTGVPSELLARRPDIRSARLRVEAADYRVGAALADMFPSLRLSGSYGFGATALVDLFSSVVWSAVASVSQPIFEGGRRKAQWSQSKAVLDERLQFYGKTVLTAMFEVESALVRERRQMAQLSALREQLELARVSYEQARSRYFEGLDDFLRVLTALQAVQSIEQNQLNAERQLLSFRVQLCRALGGPWTTTLSRGDEPGEREGGRDGESS